DAGHGFSEQLSFRLPRPTRDKPFSSFLFVVPQTVGKVRFDPSTHPCRFRFECAAVQRLSRPMAAIKMLSAIRTSIGMRELLKGQPARSAKVVGGRYRAQLVELYRDLIARGEDFSPDWIASFEPNRSELDKLARTQQLWPRQP